jgi:hypothetical protein
LGAKFPRSKAMNGWQVSGGFIGTVDVRDVGGSACKQSSDVMPKVRSVAKRREVSNLSSSASE